MLDLYKGFDRARQWKRCKWSNNNCQKGVAAFSLLIQLLVSFPALLLQLPECFIVMTFFNCLLPSG